jgi:hypothetical protein
MCLLEKSLAAPVLFVQAMAREEVFLKHRVEWKVRFEQEGKSSLTSGTEHD